MESRLHAQMHAFAAHLRDPESHPAPEGIEPRRLQVYNDLFFNSISGLLASSFPVIRQTLGDDAWARCVRRFYARHHSHCPLFTRVACEFITHLEQDRAEDDPPWLAELAHYEWCELAVQIDDSPLPPHDAHGDLLAGVPVLSPWLRLLAYAWPVHRIGPEWRPADTPPAEPTLLLVRRDHDGRARFSQLSPLVHRLFQRLQQGGASGREQLAALAQEAGAGADPGFIEQAAALLGRMREEGSVLGTHCD
jgi:hypothetical protein